MGIGRLPTIAIALVILITGMPLQAAQANHISDTLLPDLGMHRLRKFTVETTAAGQTRLRFTTIIINIGDGPFEVLGHTPSNGEMEVDQRIANSNGTWTTNPTNFAMFFAGDGHTHWHVRDLATYELKNTAATIKRTGEKHGFCFFDNKPSFLTLPDAPQSAQYLKAGCGEASDTTVTTGLSIGWGDRYAAGLPDQYIDITGLPSGEYTLTATVDEQGFLTERCEANNTTTAVLRISGSSVSIVNQGIASKACAP
ncbi:MAG: lysyl oxidase family protein [Gemmatimonadota bacterium]|nr:lysyl oxidase family protein [Gemmatimonadota bacterium]